MTPFRIAVALTLGMLASASTVRAADPPSFAKDIKPLLTKYCTECHGANGAKAGYNADGYSSLTKKGKKGALVVPSNPDQSLLVKVLSGGAKAMPPAKYGKKPTADEVTKIKDWIKAGAKDDSAAARLDLSTPDLIVMLFEQSPELACRLE